MLALFAFVILRILGESADAAGIEWAEDPSRVEDDQYWQGYCKLATDLPKFNASRFAGDWYIWRYVRQVDITRNCELERFKVEDDNQMSSEISYFTEPDCKYIAEKRYYKLVDPSEPDIFKSRTNVSDPSTESFFQIVDTDYDSWASLYRDCRVIDDQCSDRVVILVRDNNAKPPETASRTFRFSRYQMKPVMEPEDFKKNHCHPCSLI